MSLKSIGDRFDALNFTDQVTRGASWSLDLELYEGEGGGCAQLVQGDPLDLTGLAGVTTRGRVTGTDERIDIVAGIANYGSAAVPARLQINVGAGEVEKAFAEGATRAFRVTVYSTNTNNVKRVILNGSVKVRESAEGAI